jgi:flagellar hook protein FlgE
MTQAFYTGISGIKNNSTGIDILANNIANVSTVGYRGYTTEFSSMFEKNISTGIASNNSVGYGVQVQATSMVQEQGSLASSDRNTDIAILGDGWFGIQGKGEAIYTRAGDFTFDENSDLVTSDGFYVLGTVAGNISADNVLTRKVDEVLLGDITAQEKLRFPKTLRYPV